MHIGTVEINSQLALAPMAGVTDAAFRQICSELGAGYTITELISSKALCYHDKKTFSLLTQFPESILPPCRSSAATPSAWQRPPRSPWSTAGQIFWTSTWAVPGENRQQRRRRGPDERPGKGRPYCGSGGESAARHPGYRQIPPGLGSGTLQLRGICPDAGAGRRFRRGRPRPHPRARSTAAPPTGTASGP